MFYFTYTAGMKVFNILHMYHLYGVLVALLTMFTAIWSRNMNEELDADYSNLSVSNVDIPPNYNIILSNAQGQVCALDFNGPELKFSGDAEQGAQVFIDWVAGVFKNRLQQERRQERERCIKAAEESRVVNIIWYPKGHVISANKVNEIYEFQLNRTLDKLKELPDE